jgi:hypothetical protein
MSKLATAANNRTTTENGAASFKSTLNKNLDLFFKVGASRGKDLWNDFRAAYAEDKDLAVRIMLWARDARGGAGERQVFRTVLQQLVQDNPIVARKILPKVPELGRWDDLKVFMGTPLEFDAATLWADAIRNGNGLAAKWAPRKDSKGAKPLRRVAGLTEQGWRKLVVGATKVVEQKMCAREWSDIEYSHVPSVAAARYQAAFAKHDPAGYEAYRQALVSGEAKVNAAAIFPHDVVKAALRGDETVSDAQWKALPDYLEGSEERFLPLVDVSGSMGVQVSPGTTAMDISVALGMYLAERNTSIFKDEFITFESSTNLEAALHLILDAAIQHKLTEDDMPTKLLVLSDMQFNSWGVQGDTAFKGIARQYENAGYEMPQVVWWNLADRAGNIPVTENDTGTAMVSGFSPAIMTSLLGGNLTPVGVMLDAVMKERYDW